MSSGVSHGETPSMPAVLVRAVFVLLGCCCDLAHLRPLLTVLADGTERRLNRMRLIRQAKNG
jgi:hypothetical protein